MLKLLKKFDQKQLENNPLFWSTRFYPFLIASIGMWALSFVLGFLTFSTKALINHDYEQHFFHSFYNWFYVIAVIVVITFWAIQFYKHNAYNRFYPLERFYFQKKFVLIFIPIVLLTTGYYPFTYGAKLKTSYLLDERQLTEDFIELNRISAFLPTHWENYRLQNRVFPNPFPCQMNFRNGYDNLWEYRSIYLPLTMDENDHIRTVVSVDWDEKEVQTVGDREYIFFSSEPETIDNNICETKSILKGIHKIDPVKFDLSSNGILNYGTVLVPPYGNQYFAPKASNYFDTVYTPYMTTEDGQVFKSMYVKETHEIAQTNDWKRLEKLFEKPLFILNKYHIDHEIDVKSLIKYFKLKKFKNIHEIIHLDRYFESLDNALERKDYTLNEYNELSIDYKLEVYSPMFIDLSALKVLRNNLYKSTHKNGFAKLSPMALNTSFSLAFLFFLLSVVKLKSFFISIPVWGVLLILVGVVIGNSFQGMSGIEFFIPSIFLFMLVLVTALNWWFLRDSKISLKPLHVSISMALLAIPAVPSLIITLVHLSSKSKKMIECGSYDYESNYEYEYLWNGFLVNPFFLFAVTFVAALCSFYMLRIYRSKPE